MKIKKDINKAIAYMQKAADLGDSKSLVNLGSLYEEGKEVKHSLQAAFSFYEKAAKLYDPLACYYLAISYAKMMPPKLEEAKQHCAAAIMFEKMQQNSSFLSSGIMDEYIPITEEATLLFKELKNIEDVLSKADESKENQIQDKQFRYMRK